MSEVKTGEILVSLKSLSDSIMINLEKKLAYHNFHDIGEELQSFADIYIIAQEIKKLDTEEPFKKNND